MKGQSRDEGAVLASLQGVQKDYGKVRALDGLDLQVHGGELLALLGPNGAGKTTAIALLLGLARVDCGEVALFGQSPSQLAARRRIGVMLQSAGIPDTLRVAIRNSRSMRGRNPTRSMIASGRCCGWRKRGCRQVKSPRVFHCRRGRYATICPG